MTDRSSLQMCLFGASPDSGNLGVSALCYATVSGLVRAAPGVDVTVFDEGFGVRRATVDNDEGSPVFLLCGATSTRRVWQRRSYWNMRVSSWLGGLGNPAVARLRAADAVLDISGGDSFTDLYGPRRFAAVTSSKHIALRSGKPLVLLPQTYGPFNDPERRRVAGVITRRAAMAWARDARSFAVLQELLGAAFDPARHRCGVDVAFALEPRTPRRALPGPLDAWLAGVPGHRDAAVIGMNVSGLIWNDPAMMRSRYGFKADYRAALLGFLRHILRTTDARVLLIPHVNTPPGHFESDRTANAAVRAALLGDDDTTVRTAARTRVAAIERCFEHPGEAKWLIAQLDWFCGTRMHATIAGLSSGVPTAAVAYSPKALGVFETCGQGRAVSDPRARTTDEVIADLCESFRRHARTRDELRPLADKARRVAVEQMAAIVTLVERTRAASPSEVVA